MNRRAHRAGFTLVELLIVITILGVLLTLTFGSYLRWQRQTLLVQAATQLQQDVQRGRSLSKRGAQAVTLTVTGNTTYTLAGQARTLPGGVTFGTARPTLTFQAPFGTLDLTGVTLPVTFPLRSTVNTSLTRTVRVVNLFGTTVRQ